MKTEILRSILSELQGIRKALEPTLKTGDRGVDTPVYYDPNPCQYEQDDTTAMNCRHCGRSKWLHGEIQAGKVRGHDGTYCFSPTDQKTKLTTGTAIGQCGQSSTADQKPKLPESWGFAVQTIRTKQENEMFKAFQKLYDLRNAYWGEWKPDWENQPQFKKCIVFDKGKIVIISTYTQQHFLAFEADTGQAQHFLKHHRELIEQARELL